MTKADKDTIYVLCCSFFWNALCEVKKRFDEDVEESKVYIAEIAEIIKPLKPILIYIDKANVKAAKGSMFDYEDSMQSLVERRARELQILRELEFDYYTISQDICVEEFVFFSKHISLFLSRAFPGIIVVYSCAFKEYQYIIKNSRTFTRR